MCTWQRDKVRSDHSRGDEPRASAGGTRILRVRFSRPLAASPSLSRAMPFLTLPGAALRPGGQSRGLQRRRPLPRGRCLPLPGGGGQRRGSPRSEWGRVTSPDASLSPDNSRRFEPDSHRSLILIFFFFFFPNLSFTGCWTFTFKINTISGVIKFFFLNVRNAAALF